MFVRRSNGVGQCGNKAQPSATGGAGGKVERNRTLAGALPKIDWIADVFSVVGNVNVHSIYACALFVHEDSGDRFRASVA